MKVLLTAASPGSLDEPAIKAPEVSLELERSPTTIGRARETDLCLPESHVSRQHCQLECLDDVVVVRDTGSKNGTYVNGLRVYETVIKPGDRLTVGGISFIVEYQTQR